MSMTKEETIEEIKKYLKKIAEHIECASESDGSVNDWHPHMYRLSILDALVEAVDEMETAKKECYTEEEDEDEEDEETWKEEERRAYFANQGV